MAAGVFLCNFPGIFMAECFQHHKASNQFVFNVLLNGSHGNARTISMHAHAHAHEHKKKEEQRFVGPSVHTAASLFRIARLIMDV